MILINSKFLRLWTIEVQTISYYKKQNKIYSINLFHSRLSIIDFKDRSNQPFCYKKFNSNL